MIASHHSGFIDMAGFSERLRQLRQERKITQTRLAGLLEVQPRVYNRWENGDAVPHLDTVVRLAEVLGVTLDELVGRQDSNGQPIVRNPELLRLYKELDTLPDEDQKAALVLLDSLVKRAQIDRVVGKR